MGSNIDNDYLNESEEIIESGKDDTLVVNNTGDNIVDNIVDNTVIERERDIIEPMFKKPKLTLRKNLYKTTASDKVAEPMIAFLKSRTRKSAPVEEPPELLFFKSLIPDYKKLNDKNQRKFKNLVMSSLNSYLDSQEDNNQIASFQNNINKYPRPIEEQINHLYQASQIMKPYMNYLAGQNTDQQINQNQNVNNYYSDSASDLSSSSQGSNNSFK